MTVDETLDYIEFVNQYHEFYQEFYKKYNEFLKYLRDAESKLPLIHKDKKRYYWNFLDIITNMFDMLDFHLDPEGDLLND